MSGRDEAYWAKPVRTLTVRTVPADAVNANVAGRRVAGAAQGFGQLWHKRFRVRLDGARVSPQEVIRVWKDLCLDRGLQWSQAKNVWHNAGIHSAIHVIGAPLRRVARRVD